MIFGQANVVLKIYHNHNIIVVDKIHKKTYNKCADHNKFFPEEDGWFPSTSEYFYKNSKNSVDGLYPSCKRCESKRAIKWTKDNADKRQIIQKRYDIKEVAKAKRRRITRRKREDGRYEKYRKNNPEMFKRYIQNKMKRLHTITKEEWDSRLKYFNYQCAYCGMSLDEHYKLFNEQLHREHVNHQGSNSLDNCVPSCKMCNSYKWEYALDEWYNSNNQNYTQQRYEKINQWLIKDYKLYIIIK